MTFYADNCEELPILIKPTNLNYLLFTTDYARSHELENHRG